MLAKILRTFAMLGCIWAISLAPALSWADSLSSPDAAFVQSLAVKAAGARSNIYSAFKQTRYVSFLDEEMTSEGWFSFKKPDELVWCYTSPSYFRLDYKGGQATFSHSQNNKLKSGTASAQEAKIASIIGDYMVTWISMDMQRIQNGYDIKVEQREPAVLLMTPKQKKAGSILSLRLEFAPGNVDMHEVTVQEPDEDFIRIQFFPKNHPQTSPAGGANPNGEN